MPRIKIPQNRQKKPAYPKSRRTVCEACKDKIKQCANCPAKIIYDINDELIAKQYNKDWRKKMFDTIFQ